MQEEDKSIFKQAMQDVTPLKGNNKQLVNHVLKKKHSQVELLRQVRQKHNNPRTEQTLFEDIALDMGKSIPKVTAFESLLFYKKGMRLQEVTKLKKGDCIIQQSLDLHGLTVDQAKHEIIEFLKSAYFNKLRYIRIIHGKGYNSKEEFPALKNLVNLILRQSNTIIGFASTPQKDGGTGAVNIFLKAQ